MQLHYPTLYNQLLNASDVAYSQLKQCSLVSAVSQCYVNRSSIMPLLQTDLGIISTEDHHSESSIP